MRVRIFCDENIVYHDGINLSILDMILYYGFARYYHWENWYAWNLYTKITNNKSIDYFLKHYVIS